MGKFILFALAAIYKRVAGRTLFNGNTYYWGKGSCCALILLAVIMAGCTLDGQDMSNVYSTCTIDSCEYVVVSGITEPTHKGNCKYCAQRDSIKWEKRKAEIVELLKRELAE